MKIPLDCWETSSKELSSKPTLGETSTQSEQVSVKRLSSPTPPCARPLSCH